MATLILALLLRCSLDGGDYQKMRGVPDEPIDVPAIPWDDFTKAGREDGAFLLGFDEECKFMGGTMDWAPKPIGCHVKRSTCADKSRVLLTSEDGKKHCIKF